MTDKGVGMTERREKEKLLKFSKIGLGWTFCTKPDIESFSK